MNEGIQLGIRQTSLFSLNESFILSERMLLYLAQQSWASTKLEIDIMEMNSCQSDFAICFRTEDTNTILFQSQKLVLSMLS
jgi:hypothetical protein